MVSIRESDNWVPFLVFFKYIMWLVGYSDDLIIKISENQTYIIKMLVIYEFLKLLMI